MSSASLSVHIYTYIAILAHPSIDVCVVWLLCINTYILTFGPATLSLSDRGGGKVVSINCVCEYRVSGRVCKKEREGRRKKKTDSGEVERIQKIGRNKKRPPRFGILF